MSIVERALEKLQGRAPVETPVAATASATAALVTVAAAKPTPRVDPPEIIESAPKAVVRPRLTLDLDALRLAGLLPPASEERGVLADVRRIKRPIVSRALDRATDGAGPLGVVVVASAVSGEGKSFTSWNLALSIALEKDASVLLIDADIPKPQISTVLGIRDRPGLIDALLDPALDVEALIHETDRNNLTVLGAGTGSDMATELLASERMAELVATLRAADPNRIILFESPPLLLTTEARELTAIAGQVVLVVRAGETPRQALIDVVGLLGDTERVSLVLNQVDGRGGDSNYYGYGSYGSYGAYGDRPLKTP